jgi:type I restriction enzyme S subunit
MGSEAHLPAGWRYASIGEMEAEGLISEIQDGNHGERHPKSSDYVPAGVPFVMARDLATGRLDLGGCSFIPRALADSLRIGFAKPGDVLLTHKATMGRVAIVPEGFDYVMLTPQVTYYRVGDSARLSNHYLRYAFLAPDFQHQLNSSSEQSTRKYIGVTDQRRLRIPLPPIAEQESIARILDSLNDKIELNRRISQTLGSLVRGYVDRAVADRPMVPYGSALEVRMGAPFKGAAFSAPGSGRPLLRIRDLKTFVSDTWTTEIRGDETTIGPGDIVVGMDAEFRATLWLGEESVLNQRVCSFRGIDGIGRAFVLAAVRPDLEFQEQAKTGTTVIHLNKADIDTFTVPELSATEHRHLATTTEPLIELVVAHSAQNLSLIAIRDALIPRLLSNRIRVPQEVSA